MPSGLAEEWTYRFLAAATLATTEHQALQCISPDNVVEATDLDPGRPDPSPAPPKSARWTHSIGLSVPDRGRLRPAIWRAWPGRSMPAQAGGICYSALAARLVGNTDERGRGCGSPKPRRARRAAYELARVCTRAVPGNHV
jgi:hypothetical protein